MDRIVHKAFGFSLDAYFGFPVFKEVSSTNVVCTAPGYYVGAVQVFARSQEKRKVLTLARNGFTRGRGQCEKQNL